MFFDIETIERREQQVEIITDQFFNPLGKKSQYCGFIKDLFAIGKISFEWIQAFILGHRIRQFQVVCWDG